MTKVHFKPIWIFRTSGHWRWTDEIKGHLVLNKISTMPRTLSLTASVFMWLTFHLGPPTRAVLRPSLTQSVAFRTASWYFTIVCLFLRRWWLSQPYCILSRNMWELASSTARTLARWQHQPCYWHSIQWFYSFVMVSCNSFAQIDNCVIISYRHNIISSSNSDQASLWITHDSIPLSSITCFSHAAGSFEPPVSSKYFYGICARPWQPIHTYS